jgi:hypothetical protein
MSKTTDLVTTALAQALVQRQARRPPSAALATSGPVVALALR